MPRRRDSRRGSLAARSAGRATAALVGLLALATPSAAWGRPQARLLHVREPGAERCPSAEQLRSRVAERLGYDPFRDDASMTVRAAFRLDERQDHKLAADVEAFDDRSALLGRRSLASTDETCRDLADSVVLAVTLLLDAPPSSTSAAPAPAPAPERPAVATTPAREASASPPPAPPTPAPALAWTVSVGLDLVAGVGFAPAPSVGARLYASLRRGPWSVAAGGRLDLPAEGRYAAGTVETAVRLGELAGCGHLGRGFLCVVGAAGAITADGANVLQARQTVGPFGTLGARVGGDLALFGPIALRASADVAALLVRTRVTVGPETLFTTPALGGTVGIGLVGRFP
ncbi:MAG TPA: hypothetical protein PLR99_04465 [Polyangiaceae bacterium]|nr:hypothetical protein [Polyangiaceae bacterium]